MRAKKVKKIKASVYGDYSPKARSYTTSDKGVVKADERRVEYQQKKKQFKKGIKF